MNYIKQATDFTRGLGKDVTNMELTPEAQRLLAYYIEQSLAGMMTSKEYLNKVKEIYRNDRIKQQEFLIEQGFKESGAFRNIFNLDQGEDIV